MSSTAGLGRKAPPQAEVFGAMSHYSTIKTRLVEQAYLLRALEDLGYKGKVKVYDKPIRLRGFLGEPRRQKAEIVIKRKFVGLASNDLGFRRTEEGTYDAMISAYDQKKYSRKWLGRLAQRYAYHAAVDTLRDQGFEIVDETQGQKGQLNVTLRRAV